MPILAEFAAAPQIGKGKNPAVLGPYNRQGGESGGLNSIEAAVPRDQRGPWPWLRAIGQPIEMGVRLNPSLPLTLEARTGASEASLDLSGRVRGRTIARSQSDRARR